MKLSKTMSSFLKNTLSNYFEVDLPDDQVYYKQTRSIKQRIKQKGKPKEIVL
jgi:hypothetical protein